MPNAKAESVSPLVSCGAQAFRSSKLHLDS